MDKSETDKNGTKSIIAVSVYSTPEDAVKLFHGGKFCAPMFDSKLLTETDERVDRTDRTNYDNGSCREGATTQAEAKVGNKGTSKFFAAECRQNWSETIIVEKSQQDFRSETLFVDRNKQTLKEEMHLVRSEHSIVQTKVNLNYTMTEKRKENRSSAFASRKQTSEELSVSVELLHESAEATTVKKLLPHVQQANLFRVTMFYVDDLLLEEANK